MAGLVFLVMWRLTCYAAVLLWGALAFTAPTTDSAAVRWILVAVMLIYLKEDPE